MNLNYILLQATGWEIVTAVSSAVMAFGVFGAVLTFQASQRSNHLQTIEKCSDEYRRYMKKIQRGKFSPYLKRDLLGLFHKQLFYVEYGYLPHAIKVEWLKTMHSILHDDLLHEKYGRHYTFPLKYDKIEWQSFDNIVEFMTLSETQIKKKHAKLSKKELCVLLYKNKYLGWGQRFKLLYCKNRKQQWQTAFEL
ncbi:hypothetical protein [uncultured Draconibacterium sp.]|uniref:hypothetical protein n=1 Tax=uncultured Draconibacterium sp. TaxID=1573823 RepID=UPI003216944C